ncbi:MAG: hypothetical protein NXY57DRAFT_965539 [Lentinula lateritia]|nr:MAG: hypothetical protein NXY57DRAFT_965539 [Lentinula lateritia]
MSRVTRSQSRAASNASGDTNFPDIMELIQQSRDTARVATPVAETSRSVGFPSVRSREKRPARNRLSPPHRINSVPFNGQFTPSKKYVEDGTTIGIYFGRARAVPEVVPFKSKINKKGAPAHVFFKRRIYLWSRFSDSTIADNLYEAFVVVDGRGHFVGGTYDQTSGELNQAIAALGCDEIYKGDIGIAFFTIRQPDRFVESLPRYKSEQEKKENLARVITAFAQNVRNHVENETPLKYLLRG